MNPATLALIFSTIETVVQWGQQAYAAHEAGKDPDPAQIQAVAAQIAALCRSNDQAWLDGEVGKEVVG